MIPFLPLKDITAMHEAEIMEAIRQVVGSGWYLQGEATQRIEREYADYIGTQYCVGVGNGLDALTLIYRAYIELGIMQPGDEVIVPAHTYIASILAITENGLKPVLAEPRLDTLELDDTRLEQLITPRTRSLLLVHLYGRCAYTERIGELCRKHRLKLVEDNAQAHGCYYNKKGTRTGALGDAAGHSFYPGKNLGALGDGGAVTTSDEELAQAIRALGNYGSQKKYVSKYQGRNSRLDELQAAVLSVKLCYLDEDNAHRQQVARYYYDHIKNPLVALPQRQPDENNVYHLFPVLCSRRDQLQQYLAEQGIQTLIHYPIAPHRQECYREWNTLSLPMSPVLSAEQAQYVVEAINRFEG